MPVYPAMALLLGGAMAMGGDWVRRGTKALAVITLLAGVVALAIFFAVRHVPTPGDISGVLHHQATYRLSLSHMLDLSFTSFAYLRFPLLLAGLTFLAGAAASFCWKGEKAFVAAALMMVLFFQAARLAMVKFDPYLSSRALAGVFERSPSGTLIVNGHYYPFSSLAFYTDRQVLLLNGRSFNLLYGASSPDAPDVFLDDARFRELWLQPQRYYLAAPDKLLSGLKEQVGDSHLFVVSTSGGKLLLTNHSISR